MTSTHTPSHITLCKVGHMVPNILGEIQSIQKSHLNFVFHALCVEVEVKGGRWP